MIPISKPQIGKEEEEAVLEVLRSGMLAQGEKVAQFEREFAGYTGTKEAIAVSSGTAALQLSLLACGIKEGDEVITTPFTFYATASTILMCGARPVFVDIEADTFNIDPEKVKEAITERTKAIVPVHLYGQTATMDRLLEIAHGKDIAVIEDACQAHGAEFKGKRAGALSGIGCFSFYATKNMITGEGGMVTVDDPEIADRLRLLRSHGQVSRYDHVSMGFNLRMTNLSAAIGIEQLKKLPGFSDRRRANAKQLDEGLREFVQVPVVAPHRKHVYHQYTIRVPKDRRGKVMEHLKEKGIGAVIYYPKLICEYSSMKEFSGEFPVAQEAREVVFSLPVHPGVSQDDVVTIVKEVKEGLS